MRIRFNELCGVGNSCCCYFEEIGINCGFRLLNSEVIGLFSQEPFFLTWVRIPLMWILLIWLRALQMTFRMLRHSRTKSSIIALSLRAFKYLSFCHFWQGLIEDICVMGLDVPKKCVAYTILSSAWLCGSRSQNNQILVTHLQSHP
jgi:hypothetical protein